LSVPQKRLLFLVINFSNSHSFLFSCEFSLIAFIISTHNLSIFLALAEQATDYKSAVAGLALAEQTTDYKSAVAGVFGNKFF
jgi:hypothetical protein